MSGWLGRPRAQSGFWDRPRRRASPVKPSANFLLVLLVFLVVGGLLWVGSVNGKGAAFVFVVSGWVVSLCLHEFAHAYVAYKGGDYTVVDGGYLGLDPLKYSDPLLSVALPLVFVLMGGFGLPGGAVWLRRDLLRGPWWDAAVSAAGPFANALFLLGLAGAYALLPPDAGDVAPAIAVLAFFQATAIVLNLLPIPGLDGFGILRPLLPNHVAEAGVAVAGGIGFMLVFLVLSSPQVGRLVFVAGSSICQAAGLGGHDVYEGWHMLRLF